jgi:hypothetical protein
MKKGDKVIYNNPKGKTLKLGDIYTIKRLGVLDIRLEETNIIHPKRDFTVVG